MRRNGSNLVGAHSESGLLPELYTNSNNPTPPLGGGYLPHITERERTEKLQIQLHP